MNKIILLILLSSSLFGAYGFKRSITIDHTQVGGSDSTNFPLLVSGTFSYLATTANGGNVTNSNGYDIVFTSDSGCASTLNFERVLYTASSGLIEFWVKVPTVSHTADTVIYECYGNSSITTDQSNKTGTWDSNYRAVYHLQESSNPYNDSTGNARNSTGGIYPSQISGLFGKAQQFASASSQYIQVADAMSGASGVSSTWSGWIKLTNATLSVLYDDRSDGARHGGVVYVDSSAHANAYFNNLGQPAGSTSLNDGAWHYVVGVLRLGGSPTVLLYVDGSFVTSAATGTFGGWVSGNTAKIGASTDASPLFANASMQEIRISQSERSADWVTAEYNNQKSGSTMLTISAPLITSVGGGGIILQ